MIKNYLKVAARAVLKYRGYYLINISGLAIGMTCFILIALYVQHELSYDKQHEPADRIFRVAVRSTTVHRESGAADTPYPLAPVLREGLSGLDKIGRLYMYGEALIEANSKKIYEERFSFAEPEFLEIFSLPMIVGSERDALSGPNSVVVTASIANKYFGRTDVLGETLRFNNRVDLAITGVLQDLPSNSHFHFDFLASFTTIDREIVGADPNQWGMYFGIYTYARVASAVDPQQVEAQISEVLNQKANHGPSVSRKLFLQPLRDIHLHSHLESEIEPNNRPVVLFILATIGVLIVLIACINFMNLATARSARRSKEVGMRKVLGAAKQQLLRQFLGESIWLAMMALFLSLGLVEIFLPGFNSLVGKSLSFNYAEHPLLPLGLILLSLIVGVLAGTYPALVLASFKPIDSLKAGKNVHRSANSQVLLRRALVVTQFAISAFLIAGTLIINRQLDYFRSAKLGFDSDLTVVIPMEDESMTEKYHLIKENLLTYPQVRSVTASYKAPIGENSFDTSLFPRGRDGDERLSINVNFVDYDFLEAFSLELMAGRNFSPEFSTDEMNAFIVNESALRKLGFVDPEDALGRKYLIGVNRIQGTIVGVTRDFHISSLHEEIQPLVMMYWPRLYNALSVRIIGNDVAGTLPIIEKTWASLFPSFPFRYEFLDDYIATLYQTEELSQKIIGTFSFLAVAIACLGMLGLASFTAEQRTKEIGVRKVLGSSVPGIIALLNRECVKLVLIASVFAGPVVWFVMNRWLEEFAYRVTIGWQPFLLSTGLMLLVALVTVSYQAVKAALTNPVDALRFE